MPHCSHLGSPPRRVRGSEASLAQSFRVMTLKHFWAVAIIGSSKDPLASLLHVLQLEYIKQLGSIYVDHMFTLKSNDKLMYRFLCHRSLQPRPWT